MTLVISIPTADGFVMAADSRALYEGHFYDYREKLHVGRGQGPIGFAVTGSADFPWTIAPGYSPAEWLPHVPYFFRAKDKVQTYLERNPGVVLNHEAIHEVAHFLALSVVDFFTEQPEICARHIGRDMCRLVLCQVDPLNDEPLYGAITLSIDLHRKVSLTNPRFMRYRAIDTVECELNGEGEYVTHHVVNGEGRHFIHNDDAELWAQRGEIRNFGKADAARYAAALIRAAEQTTERFPIPSGSGIGGRVTTLLVKATACDPLEPDRNSRGCAIRDNSGEPPSCPR